MTTPRSHRPMKSPERDLRSHGQRQHDALKALVRGQLGDRRLGQTNRIPGSSDGVGHPAGYSEQDWSRRPLREAPCYRFQTSSSMAAPALTAPRPLRRHLRPARLSGWVGPNTSPLADQRYVCAPRTAAARGRAVTHPGYHSAVHHAAKGLVRRRSHQHRRPRLSLRSRQPTGRDRRLGDPQDAPTATPSGSRRRNSRCFGAAPTTFITPNGYSGPTTATSRPTTPLNLPALRPPRRRAPCPDADPANSDDAAGHRDVAVHSP